ncbi:MAG: DUF7269 family protein [Candidatus Bipolaricaulia bacterium]
MVAAAGLLALALRGPMAAFLTGPLTRLWWLVDSLPQRLVWGVLALLGFLVTFFLGRGPKQVRPEPEPPPWRSPSQIERLAQLIQLAEDSPWARDLLRRRLRKVMAGLQALREGINLDEAQEAIESGRWPADPRLAAMLREGEARYAADLAYTLDALERYMHDEGGWH